MVIYISDQYNRCGESSFGMFTIKGCQKMTNKMVRLPYKLPGVVSDDQYIYQFRCEEHLKQ